MRSGKKRKGQEGYVFGKNVVGGNAWLADPNTPQQKTKRKAVRNATSALGSLGEKLEQAAPAYRAPQDRNTETREQMLSRGFESKLEKLPSVVKQEEKFATDFIAEKFGGSLGSPAKVSLRADSVRHSYEGDRPLTSLQGEVVIEKDGKKATLQVAVVHTGEKHVQPTRTQLVSDPGIFKMSKEKITPHGDSFTLPAKKDVVLHFVQKPKRWFGSAQVTEVKNADDLNKVLALS